MLVEYMTALTKRYNDEPQVKWLDVVNETITEKGTWFGPKPGVTAWENPWTKMGFITDIPAKFPLLSKQGVPKSISLMKELVMYLRDRNLRVDAIGWQAHLRGEHVDFANPDSAAIKAFANIAQTVINNHKTGVFHGTYGR